uniref:Uncharacterized protein n=1 Tax=Oryza sativa subsp. japonica TaxID=39947 RepID=Q5N895_ORYSJ|nr:hypothetical protein [Oryza sativa Japonica Group]
MANARMPAFLPARLLDQYLASSVGAGRWTHGRPVIRLHQAGGCARFRVHRRTKAGGDRPLHDPLPLVSAGDNPAAIMAGPPCWLVCVSAHPSLQIAVKIY